MTDASQLLILSKSEWNPPIRREHVLAMLAARYGHPVTFVERPRDVRALKATGSRSWLARLSGQPIESGAADVRVIGRSGIFPGHLNRFSESLEGLLLRNCVPEMNGHATVVATQPWQWPAMRRMGGARHVLDLADDWTALIPRGARRIRELCARAGDEADAIVVVSESLRELFPDRPVTLVRNGVDDDLLTAPLTPPPRQRHMVYVGTLSERFDASLIEAVLQRLPEWTLDLFGPCAYAGMQDQPAPELTRLMDNTQRRVRWRRVITRDRLVDTLDRGDVLIVPNRGDQSRGQDSMKMYDYAARGRPIVVTAATVRGVSELPPHTKLAETADEFARLVQSGFSEPQSCALDRAKWAASQSWKLRWPAWAGALFGSQDFAQAQLKGRESMEGAVTFKCS